jgi:hypothetical protein
MLSHRIIELTPPLPDQRDLPRPARTSPSRWSRPGVPELSRAQPNWWNRV